MSEEQVRPESPSADASVDESRSRCIGGGRDASLERVADAHGPALAILAVRIGQTRLIDNALMS